MILKIMMLAPVVIVSNNAFAQQEELPPLDEVGPIDPTLSELRERQQTLHDRKLSELANQTSGLSETSQIDVGDSPAAIDVLQTSDTVSVYAANSGSDSISVIDTENNAKIGEIPVGDRPTDIGVSPALDIVYVANYGSNDVSVIDATTNTPVVNATTNEPLKIPVGDRPTDIGISEATRTVYVANSGSNDVSVIDTENNAKIGEDIPVGDRPTSIGISEATRTVYVANYGSNDVSVIDATTNTPVVNATTNEPLKIPVGDRPTDIGVLQRSDRVSVYVANNASNTVSVITTTRDNTARIENVTVGDRPWAIGISEATRTVYVANYGSNDVSVIDATTNTPVVNATTNEPLKIPVGDRPTSIGVSIVLNATYVANSGSNSISVIDVVDNEVVAGITIHVDPLNSGYIECSGLAFPSSQPFFDEPSSLEQQYYVSSGTECIAKPNPGFEFVSWVENLEDDSIQLRKVSRNASYLDSIADFLRIRSDEPEANLSITKFGTFTANFKELPPVIPSEYWIPLYGIIASTIVGWSIPSIIGWARSKRDVGKLNYFHKQIASLYGDGKLDENDIEPLDQLTSNVIDAYSEGKISEKHYESLRNEISILYEEIFRKKIDLLDNNNPSNNKATQEQLSQIRDEVENAYSKGKINEKHYDLLNKAISNLESKEE